MGSWSIRLFRILGIELEVHLTFVLLWAFLGVVGWSEAGWPGVVSISILLLLIFTCVVLHELGHCLAAKHYGIRVPRILLLPFGGMAQFERIPRQPKQEILISLAGPAVNLILIFALLPWIDWPLLDLRSLPLDSSSLIQYLLILNIMMGLFNLLPIFPMDGGRVLRALLALRLPYLKATTIAVGLAKGLAVIGILVAIFHLHHPLLVFLFAFIYLGGDHECRIVKRREKMSGLFVRDLTRTHYQSLPGSRTMAEAAELFNAFRPGELLIMEDDVPRGYLTARIVKDAAKNGNLDDPASAHCIRKFSVLQAGWPLDPFVEMISQSSQRIYPVYSFGSMIGVVDTRNLDSLIASHRLQAEERHRASATAKAREKA